MNNGNFGVQHVNTLIFRSLSNIDTGKKLLRKGETVLYLKDVELLNLETQKATYTAHSTVPLLHWFVPTDMRLTIKKGVINSTDLALLLDSGIIEADYIKVSRREEKTVNKSGKITLSKKPIPQTLFCYYNGEMILNTPINNDNTITIGNDFIDKTVLVDYRFMTDKVQQYRIGPNILSNRHFEIEAQFEYKSDETGDEYTGIFIMPCANVVGEINFLLGDRVSPIVGNLACYFVEPITRGHGEKEFCTISFLKEDLEAL